MRLKNSFFQRAKSSCGTGFTLVEVLIVVVVIAVIATFALPRFYPQREKAIAAYAATMLSAIRFGERSYWYLSNPHQYVSVSSSAPADPGWQLIEVGAPGIGGNAAFTYTVNAAAKTATAVRTGSQNPSYEGKTITINLDDATWSGDHPFTPKNN